MFKKASLMFIYTESSLHAGSGASLGVIDLPIQREKYTDYPVLQASGVKGAIRDWFGAQNFNKDDIEAIFGPEFTGSEAFAGAASFTDGRLLIFPVRSLKGVFAYTTSCFALSRLKRDLSAIGVNVQWNLPQNEQNDSVLGINNSNLVEVNKVVLEEYAFNFVANDKVREIAEWLSQNALPKGDEYEFWRDKIKKDLLVLPDDVFRDFVKTSTEVQARIKLDKEKKTTVEGALFYEEALMPDTLLYSIVMANDPFKKNNLKDASNVIDFIEKIDGRRTQFGGDTTIGKGIVNIRFFGGAK